MGREAAGRVLASQDFNFLTTSDRPMLQEVVTMIMTTTDQTEKRVKRIKRYSEKWFLQRKKFNPPIELTSLGG